MLGLISQAIHMRCLASCTQTQWIYWAHAAHTVVHCLRVYERHSAVSAESLMTTVLMTLPSPRISVFQSRTGADKHRLRSIEWPLPPPPPLRTRRRQQRQSKSAHLIRLLCGFLLLHPSPPLGLCVRSSKALPQENTVTSAYTHTKPSERSWSCLCGRSGSESE